MTADILKFPARAVDADERGGVVPGDLVVGCFNSYAGLWMAWPVARVEDGRIVEVELPKGGSVFYGDVMGVGDVAIYAARDHAATRFSSLRFKTFTDAADAILTFSDIAL